MQCKQEDNVLIFYEGDKVVYEEKSALPDIIWDVVDEHREVEKVLTDKGAGSGWTPEVERRLNQRKDNLEQRLMDLHIKEHTNG